MARLQELRAPLRLHDMRVVWMAQVLSELGDWAARLALAVLVFERTGSPALTALTTAVSVLPWVGLGQFLATLGDRRSRREVMVIADLVRAAVFLAMVIPQPVWLLLLLAFIAGAAAPPFEAARSALIPTVVPAQIYGDTIALTALTYQLTIVGGYMSGGGLVAIAGPRMALTFNSGSFVASALLLSRLRPEVAARPLSSATASIRDAAKLIMNDPFLRRAASFAALVISLGIVGESLVPVYVREELSGGPAAVGVVAAANPLGAIVTTLLVRIHGDSRSLLRLGGVIGFTGAATGAVAFLLDPSLPLAVVPFFCLGIVFASGLPANAVVGSRLPDDSRASGFGILMGLLQGAAVLGAVLGGYIAERLGTRETCAAALLLAAAVSFAAALWPPRGDNDSEPATS